MAGGDETPKFPIPNEKRKNFQVNLSLPHIIELFLCVESTACVCNFRYFSGRHHGRHVGGPGTPVWRYNASRNTYHACAPIPAVVKSHQLVCGGTGIIYAVGGVTFVDCKDKGSESVGRSLWVPNSEVYRYDTVFDKWNNVRVGVIEAPLGGNSTDACFFMMQCIVALRQYGEIACMDLSRKYVSNLLLGDSESREALLGELCFTQVGSTAVITSKKSFDDGDVTRFVIIDLQRVVEEHHAHGASSAVRTVDEPAPEAGEHEVGYRRPIVFLRDCNLVAHGKAFRVLALSTCCDKFLAFASSKEGDIALLTCKADDFVEKDVAVEWKVSLFQSSTSLEFLVPSKSCAKLCCVKTGKKC